MSVKLYSCGREDWKDWSARWRFTGEEHIIKEGSRTMSKEVPEPKVGRDSRCQGFRISFCVL